MENFNYEEYSKVHVACPACDSTKVLTTLVAYIDKDLNKVECLDCGWKGIGDDLVAKKDNTLKKDPFMVGLLRVLKLIK